MRFEDMKHATFQQRAISCSMVICLPAFYVPDGVHERIFHVPAHVRACL